MCVGLSQDSGIGTQNCMDVLPSSVYGPLALEQCMFKCLLVKSAEVIFHRCFNELLPADKSKENGNNGYTQLGRKDTAVSKQKMLHINTVGKICTNSIFSLWYCSGLLKENITLDQLVAQSYTRPHRSSCRFQWGLFPR